MLNRKNLAAHCAIIAFTALVGTAYAGPQDPGWGVDAPQSHDPSFLRRFKDSWLIGYHPAEWDQTVFPTGPGKNSDQTWKSTVRVEGKITRLVYLAPRGKSPLEVHRNYEQALMAAGFKPKFRCELNCDDLFMGLDKSMGASDGMIWAQGSLGERTGNSTYPLSSSLSPYKTHYLYGILSRGGQDLHVFVFTSIASTDKTGVSATLIQIAEPEPMKTGQVTVDANAMQQSLKSDGKVALYGIYFDTGKWVVKPESKAQLEEMAKLLRSQPGLKVFIVGHTDNQGTLDGNLGLSMQRAQAVSQALASNYKIDSNRIQPRGVANLVPVASNADEDGRARNRRVELVLQ